MAGDPERPAAAPDVARCREDIFKKTPIIAQTGWGQERDKAFASEAGFDHHLFKPVGLDDLERLRAEVSKA